MSEDEDLQEHPEDRDNRIRGTAEGKAAIVAWLEEGDNMERLAATIETYGDVDAQNLWDDLRDDFWSRANQIAVATVR